MICISFTVVHRYKMVNRVQKKHIRNILYRYNLNKQHKGLMKCLTSPILVGEMSRPRQPLIRGLRRIPKISVTIENIISSMNVNESYVNPK